MSILIAGVIDPADRLGEASPAGTAVTLGILDSLLRELSGDPRPDTRLAAASSAGPDRPSPGASDVAPAAPELQPAADPILPAEDSVLKELDKLLARLNAEAATRAPARSLMALTANSSATPFSVPPGQGPQRRR